jgi:outer membrane immunogenic protein
MRSGTILGLLVTAIGGPVHLHAAGLAGPVHNWSGLYGGTHGGYGFGDADYAFLGVPNATARFAPVTVGGRFGQSVDGGALGGHFGFNHQFGNLLVGLESGFTWSALKGSSTDPFAPAITPTVTYDTELEWIATLTPRLGVVAGRWLIYGKGGVAAARARSTLVSTTPGPAKVFEEANGYLGWTAGIGAEYALSPNWIVGLEYNFTDLGSQPFGGSAVPRNAGAGGGVEYAMGLQFSTVLARLSYRLGPAATDGFAAAAATASTSMWTGFYAGVHGGYGFGRADYHFVPFGNGGSFAPPLIGGRFGQTLDSGLLGGQFGFNYQRDRLVVGLEGSVTLNDSLARTSDPFGRFPVAPDELLYGTRLGTLATITPRLGVVIDRWLIFAKGGVAAGRVQSKLSNGSDAGPPLIFQEQSWHIGWTAGAGVEFALSPHWSVGIEYDYFDLGSERYGNYARVTVPLTAVDYTVDLRFSAVMARLSYRFGAPPP